MDLTGARLTSCAALPVGCRRRSELMPATQSSMAETLVHLWDVPAVLMPRQCGIWQEASKNKEHAMSQRNLPRANK